MKIEKITKIFASFFAKKDDITSYKNLGFIMAGFWRRALAAQIDIFIVLIVASIVNALITKLFSLPNTRIVHDIFTPAVFFTVGLLYFVIFEASKWSGSPGKILCGLKVFKISNQSISWQRAAIRYFFKVAFSLPMAIGFIVCSLGRNRQGLHDIASGVVVVKKAPAEYIDLLDKPLKQRFRAVFRIHSHLASAVFATVVAVLWMNFFGFILNPVLAAATDQNTINKTFDRVSMLKSEIENYKKTNNNLDVTLSSGQNMLLNTPSGVVLSYDMTGTILVLYTDGANIKDGSFEFTPVMSSEGVSWSCSAKGIPVTMVPKSCKK